jgi:hypothetical protein
MCHICGVSFNVGRIRTPTEPRREAWGSDGPIMGRSFWEYATRTYARSSPVQGSYVDPYRTRPRDCQDSGCMFAIRAIRDEERKYKINKGKVSLCETKDDDKDDDDENDGDWVQPHDDEEDEPLEYMSEDEASQQEVELHNTDVEMIDADEDSDESLTREQIAEFWLDGMLEVRDGKWLNDEFHRLIDDNENLPAWYSGKPYHMEVETQDEIVDKIIPLYKADDSVPAGRAGMSLRSRKSTGNERSYPELSESKLLESRLAYSMEDKAKIEHIAGPGCNNENGYSGREISAAEMRGCQTVQCLVRKPKGYIFDDLPDDEDFETTGEFFLSGLSDYMPSRDYDSPRVTIARHGCDRPHAENCMWDRNEAPNYAMPFHPACLEVYKHLSSLTLGKIDITLLTSWWSLEAEYGYFHKFPRHPDVYRCSEQWWRHVKGTEYLVANPLYVPKLRNIFEAATDTTPDFSPRDDAFTISESMKEPSHADPFNRLPVELRNEILNDLSSKDIASLRLASRVFCQLPISYFQTLLRRECPWLWEAWPTGAHSKHGCYAKWAYMTGAEIGETTSRHQRDLAILHDYCEMIKKDMPECASEIDAAYEVQRQAIQDAHRVQTETEEARPFYLHPGRTNYFTLYTLITRHWPQLRGLQNRERIWKDCEEILRRVAVHQKEGGIDENGAITVDLGTLVDEGYRRASERRRRGTCGTAV